MTQLAASARPAWTRHDLSAYAAPLGRGLFALIFITSAPGHFTQRLIDAAAQQGVPLAVVLVPLSGIIALAGGLSVLLGYRARVGAWLIVLFLLPVTFTMHAFWTYDDPAAREMQMINFMKNIAMLGAAFFIARMGAGPFSLDNRRGVRGRQP